MSLFAEDSSSQCIICPRCGLLPAHTIDQSSPKCTQCDLLLCSGDCYDEACRNIIARQQDNDAAPYTYNHELVAVPGSPSALTMPDMVTQQSCELVRSHFTPRDDDVWLATYPKSGTTWVQEMLSLLLYGEANISNGGQDGIGVGLSEGHHVEWMEAIAGMHSRTGQEEAIAYVDRVNATPTRRCFKSHSPLALLEPLITSRGKVIHIARNPKDVAGESCLQYHCACRVHIHFNMLALWCAVSMWHHSRSKSFSYDGPWEHFLDMYLRGHVESGLWWDYVIPYCSRSSQVNVPNEGDSSSRSGITLVHTVWYEDLIQEPVTEMLKIAAFLDVPLQRRSDEAVDGTSRLSAEEIVERCSFSAMKAKEVAGGLVLPSKIVKGSAEEGAEGTPQTASKNHIRKGGVGGWKKYFNEDQTIRFDNMHASKVASEHAILLRNIQWE
jgi:hypothetical protein